MARIRGEYREMPGLRLTFARACRLWQVDVATCTIVLQTLVDEGFLMGRQDGRFVAVPTESARLRPVKANLSLMRLRRSA